MTTPQLSPPPPTSPEDSQTQPAAFPARMVTDIAVAAVLAVIGILGFQTAFGDHNFLIGGLLGLIVGVGAALLAHRLRLGVVLGSLGAILAYFLFGSAVTMPGESLFGIAPSLTSLAGLAVGAVFGWADIVTLQTPVEAPYYIPVVPYFGAWLVGFVGAMLAIYWVPRRRRTALRAAVLLIGPTLLYLAGILVGTDEPYLAGVRGVAFMLIAVLWLGWRPSSGTRMLRHRLLGTATVVLGALLIGSLAGTLLAPAPEQRLVLREEVQPPFDPLDFSSPLSGFRKYTKDLTDTPLFTVDGMKPGDVIRLASMDAFTGKLWNVAGGQDGDGAGDFRLVGRQLTAPELLTSTISRTITVTVEEYDDVWLPGVGYPTRITLEDPASIAEADNLRHNATTGTTVLTQGAHPSYRYTVQSAVQDAVDDENLLQVPVAAITQPPVDNLPDIVAAKAEEFGGGAETPIEELRAMEAALKTKGFLSHGLASDQVSSRAGHGADRMIDLFTRSQMVGDEEQYASALALMARHSGYPARVVMGFAPKIEQDAGTIEVVGDDVTAWVEVAFEGVGWIPFYPTPDETDVPQDQNPKPKTEPQPQVRQPPRMDNEQDDLLTAVEIDDSNDEDREIPFVMPVWAWVLLGIIGIPLLLLGVPLLVITLLKARRRRRRLAASAGDMRAAGAWDELVDRYAELGFDVPKNTTRRLAARQMEAQLTEQGVTAAPDGEAIALTPIADEVDRAVFNGQTIDAGAAGKHWADIDRCLAAVAQAVGRFRRTMSRFRLRGFF